MLAYITALWNEIQNILNARYPNWKTEITGLGQVGAVASRDQGKSLSDSDVFHGFVLGLLSNTTNWSVVQRLLNNSAASAHIANLFFAYHPTQFCAAPGNHIDAINNYFKSVKAGSMVLKKSLTGLQQTSCIFGRRIAGRGSLEKYLIYVKGNSPALCLACRLGASSSKDKLPGFGIPLAAESLKNVGYDVAKPDRHICRAMASFGLVKFANWPNKKPWDTPLTSEPELRKVMWLMDFFARAIGTSATYLDNAIWILCASGGRPHLTNAELQQIAVQSRQKLRYPDPRQMTVPSPLDSLGKYLCDNCSITTD